MNWLKVTTLASTALFSPCSVEAACEMGCGAALIVFGILIWFAIFSPLLRGIVESCFSPESGAVELRALRRMCCTFITEPLLALCRGSSQDFSPMQSSPGTAMTPLSYRGHDAAGMAEA